MMLRNKHSIVLIYLSLGFLVFTSLVNICSIFAETPELFDDPITDFSIAGQPSSTLNFVNDSEFIQWSSYLGGSETDRGYSVAIDSFDNVVVIGHTFSNNFPVLNGFDESFNNGSGDWADTFISKFDSSGEMLWSSYLGGSEDDIGVSIAIDSLDNILVTGYTSSDDFPALDGFNETIGGGRDAFLSKFNSSGNLIWSTCFGGTGYDSPHSVAIDSSDNIIITGSTSSNDFPVLNNYQETYNGNIDAFISKFDSSGELIMSSFLGGSGNDIGTSVVIGTLDYIIVAGHTKSDDFPVLDGYDETFNGAIDGFISVFDPSGGITWSTYLGGTNYDRLFSIAIDSQNNIIVSGTTSSDDFPVLNGYQETLNDISGNYDAFITKFNSVGALIWSTYFGGSRDGSQRIDNTGRDAATSVTIDFEDNLILTGYTRSVDFPFLNGFDEMLNDIDDYINGLTEGSDAFISKFDSSGELIWSSYLGGSDDDYGTSVAIDSQNCIITTGYTYSDNFPFLNSFNETLNGYSDVFISKVSNPPKSEENEGNKISIGAFLLSFNTCGLLIILYRRKKHS